jgi:hypothetical protein
MGWMSPAKSGARFAKCGEVCRLAAGFKDS